MNKNKNSAIVISYTEPRKVGRQKLAPTICRTIEPITADEIEAKFVERVELLENGCWFWHGSIQKATTASRKPHPVAVFSAITSQGTRKLFTAHRYSYEKRIGKLPDQKFFALQNTCELPTCVNPYHYEIVTRKDILSKGATHIIAKTRRSATKCSKGLHDVDPDNPHRTKSGKRIPCLPCTQEIQRVMYERKKARAKE